jgi:hypothetical protein
MPVIGPMIIPTTRIWKKLSNLLPMFDAQNSENVSPIPKIADNRNV